MNMDRTQAGADLAAIDDVMRRVKQSRIYRVTGQITILWGALQIAQYAFVNAAPVSARPWSWAIVDAFGVALTIALLARVRGGSPASVGRVLGAYALFFGFGAFWAYGLAHLGAREQAVFWHSLFLFGYSLAGLWFGWRFLALGLGALGAIVAVYLLAGAWFWLLIGAVAGLGYVACGLWMLRA